MAPKIVFDFIHWPATSTVRRSTMLCFSHCCMYRPNWKVATLIVITSWAQILNDLLEQLVMPTPCRICSIVIPFARLVQVCPLIRQGRKKRRKSKCCGYRLSYYTVLSEPRYSYKRKDNSCIKPARPVVNLSQVIYAFVLELPKSAVI